MSPRTRTFKQYLHTRPAQVLAFMRSERQIHGDAALGEYATLASEDFTNEVTFFLHAGERRVGFIALRPTKPGQPRELTKLYVSPAHRRGGVASYALNALRVELVRAPLRMSSLTGLCTSLGFRRAPQQPYPNTLAVLVREAWK